MRILLTAVAAGEVTDLAVECDDDATVADLARDIAERINFAPVSIVAPVAGNPLGLVSLGRPTDPAPPAIWLDGDQVDPSEPVSTSALRHGAVLGVGAPASGTLTEPAGVVEIRVAGGRGAGRVQRLSPGTYTIGSAAGGVLVLTDAAVAPVACRIDVDRSATVTLIPDPAMVGRSTQAPMRAHPLSGPIVVPRPDGAPPIERRRLGARRRARREAQIIVDPQRNIDPQDDIPLIHLDRRPLAEASRWPPGDALVIGNTLLELAVVTAPDASLSPTHGGVTVDYNRPPRLLPPPRTTDFSLPTEPPKPDKTPLPLALILVPMVMAGGMYFLTKSLYSLMFVAMMPLMAVSTFTSGRRDSKRRYKQQLEDFQTRTRRVREDAYAALVAERSLRRRDLADPGTLLVTATGPRVRLWERRRSDPDWLLARVGTADVPSDVSVRDQKREAHEDPLSWTAPDVPVGVPLAEAGVTGVAGPDEVRRAIGRWLVAQAAVLHSPADLEIIVLADRDGGAEWSWLRWLPHARGREDDGPITLAGTDEETALGLIRALTARLQARTAAAGTSGGAPRLEPILVVLDGARRLRLLPGVVSLLQEGPRHGFYFVCLDADQRQLPEECSAVISCPDPRSGTLRVAVTGQPDIDGVRPDLVDIAWCERVARALAPVRDVSSEDLAGSLPGSSRLLTVLGLDETDPDEIVARWQRGGRTTRAVVGEGLDGPFTLDIRRDGPHGLIAGTTGSGKSELLQTLIASLSVGNRPDEMTFVLIDYKGGAAFKDCVKLPHTVGMVTDLDGHLTGRALESLGAELRRREHQLAAADTKDVEDYSAARSAGDPAAAEPMPRLMIVIDEFAALVAELPDFVVGLVDIARRGRSLGVHLMLATQRPAGVVSGEIKSNTNLRIALRVTDANDSQDVIESADAAAISKSTPGRAYARLGHSSLLPFQSSRVGGRPRGAGGRGAVHSRPFAWSNLASVPPRPTEDEDDDMSVPSDLATLVESLREAAVRAGVSAPPSPWLPPLDDTMTLADAEQLTSGADDREDVAPLTFGVVDVPSQQRRGPAVWDPATGGHLGFVGAARSGRSTALRAVAGAVARAASPRDIHLYGVDCGNNALLPLLGLPHTGAVVTRDQPDRLARLTARLIATISERQQLLAERGFADLHEQRVHAAAEDRLPYLVVLFDRWEGFVAAFDSVDAGRLIEQWTQILQEGAGVGIKVIVSADRTALTGRISTLIDDKVLLRLTDPGDYASIGLRAKEVPEHMPPGRGFRSEGLRETQVALLDADPTGSAQVAAMQTLGRQAEADAGHLPAAFRPFRVDALPTRMTLPEALALDGPDEVRGPLELPIAVGGDTLTLFGFDAVEHGPGVIIGGPRRTGRSTALQILATSAADRGWQILVLTPRQSPLRDNPPAGALMFTLDSPREEVTAAFADLATAAHSLMLIDDLELIGTDGWLVDLITDHLDALRDSESMVAAAGSLDDLSGVYRGPAVALKKSRSGILLSPQAQGDGDLFGIRLPRSVLGAPAVPGRGQLVRGGAFQGVQIVAPG